MKREPPTPDEIAELTYLRQLGAGGVLHDVLAVPLDPTGEELSAAWEAFDRRWNPARYHELEIGVVFLWLDDVHRLGQRAFATLHDPTARSTYEESLSAAGLTPAAVRGRRRLAPHPEAAIAAAPQQPGGPGQEDYAEGAAHLAAGRLIQARDAFAAALRKRPHQLEFQRAHRESIGRLGRQRGEQLAKQAADAEQMGELGRAAWLYREAVSAGAAEPAFLRRAIAVVGAEHPTGGELLALLRTATAAAPDDLDIRIAFAEALRAQGLEALARRELRSLRVNQPRHPGVVALARRMGE